MKNITKKIALILLMIILLNNLLVSCVNAAIIFEHNSNNNPAISTNQIGIFDSNSYINSKYRVHLVSNYNNSNTDLVLNNSSNYPGVSIGTVENSKGVILQGSSSESELKNYNFNEDLKFKYNKILESVDGELYDVEVCINNIQFETNVGNWNIQLKIYGASSNINEQYIGIGAQVINGIKDTNVNFTTTYKVYKTGTNTIAHIPGIFQMNDIDNYEEYVVHNLSNNIEGDIKSKIFRCDQLENIMIDLTDDELTVKDTSNFGKSGFEKSSVFILFDDIGTFGFTEKHFGGGGMDMYFSDQTTRDFINQNKQITKRVSQQKIDSTSYDELPSVVVYDNIQPNTNAEREVTYSVSETGYELDKIIIDGDVNHPITKALLDENNGTYNYTNEITVTENSTIFENINDDHSIEVIYKLTEYDIDYHLGTGEITQSPTEYKKSNDPIALQDAEKEGYDFVGWFDTQNPSDTDQPITEIPAGTVGDINLYPQWEATDYEIVYHVDGFDPTATNDPNNPTNVDVEYEVGLNVATRDGYISTGWKNTPNGSDENPITRLTSENIPRLADENNKIHLYPVWQPDPDTVYHVVYKMENLEGGWDENIVDGTGAPGVNKIRIQDYLLSEDETKGFVLDEPLDKESEISPYGDTQFEIKYLRKTTKINYDPNGGTDIEIEGESEKNTETRKFGDKIVREDGADAEEEIEKRKPTRKGYIFDVWQTEDGSTFNLTDPLIPYVEEINLKAKWIEGDSTYTVIKYKEELDGTYTEQEPEIIDATTGDEVNYFKKEKGFTIDEDNPNTVLSGIVDPEGNLILTVYYKRDEYKVIIDKNDGTDDSIIEQTKKYEEKADKVEEPTREGYIFDGWETEDGKPFSFDDPIEGNVKIKAKWKLKNGDSPKTGDPIIYAAVLFVVSGIGLIVVNKRRK